MQTGFYIIFFSGKWKIKNKGKEEEQFERRR
jgi:hypothetical protein